MESLTLANHSHLAGTALSVFEQVFGRMRGLDELAHALQLWGQPLEFSRVIAREAGWHQVIASRGSDAFTLVITASCGGRLAQVDLRDSIPSEELLGDAFLRWHDAAGRPDGRRRGAGCRFGSH